MKPTYELSAGDASGPSVSEGKIQPSNLERARLKPKTEKRGSAGENKMPKVQRSFFKDNGLTIVLAIFFLLSLSGMIASGLAHHNEDLLRHGQSRVSLTSFVIGGDFLSTLFENWESEFLQMGVYVVLTAWLFQRGSAESKDPDEDSDSGARNRTRTDFFMSIR